MMPILWREIKSLSSSAVMTVFHFTIPLFLLIFFATVLEKNIVGISYNGQSISYLDYFAPGLVGYVTFMSFQFSLTFIRHDRSSGILAIIRLARGNLNTYIGGKLAAQSLINSVKVILLISLATVALGGSYALLSAANLSLFFTALALGTVCWTAIGIALGFVIKRDDMREMISALVTMPLVFASSMYYDITRAPGWIKAVSVCNPLTYTCDLLRSAYLVESPSFLSGDLYVLLLITLAASSVAIVLSRRIEV